MTDALNAFIEPDLRIDGAPDGPLAGLTFAVKDLYATAGRVTGAGNPDWKRTHAPEPRHAAAVQALLGAGASVRGIVHTDELAFSLNGRNFHYGTPLNSAAPDRVPGGSSNGSASAVAGGAVDVALGTDTGGSVRVPASHCGLFGIRPTHGVISGEGIVPLAPSFDAVGWFARDAATLAALGDVLLPPDAAGTPETVTGLIVAGDAFAEADPEIRDAFVPLLAALETAFGLIARDGALAPLPLADAFEATRLLTMAELKRVHGDWMRTTRPAFGPGLAARFQAALDLPEHATVPAQAVRTAVTAHLRGTLAGGVLAVLPTVPAPPPFRDDPQETLEAYRFRAQRLTCPAGLAGVPQVSIPAVRIGGAPVGLSLVGAAGSDRLLLAAAAKAAEAIATITAPGSAIS
ncbi:amidase [Azospirillum isscasi]|uniref:Amidase n=1 Tax=Azospirillum isscasi TaxID=3053926 RepID=A0ABU0WAE9_9PROT|nr:amidase [Azospirillum isscasi]MDQ2101159.1 amidase [Azospirillum isscasi]